MKYMLGFLAALLSTITLAQLTQPPGGITGNLPPWAGGNGSSGQVLTSRGTTLAPTFQAAGGGGGTPGGATTNVQYNNAGAFGGNANFTYDGAGTAALSTALTAPTITAGTRVSAGRIDVTSTTTATNGFALPAGNTPTAYSNGAARFQWTSIGITALGGGGFASAGTKFTAVGTGCTVGTTVGGGTAGTFTLAAGPCTSVVITMGGATGATSTNGWSCQAHDRTALTVLIGGESSSTTTTATITIPAGAGATDVISFHCIGF